MPLSVEDPVEAPAGAGAGADRTPWGRPRVGRRERVLLVVLVAVMALAPALVALARETSHRATVELLVANEGDDAADAIGYVRSQLVNPFVRNSIVKQVGAAWAGEPEFYGDIGVAAGADGDPPSVRLTASGDSPAEARRVADIAAREIVAGTQQRARRMERGERILTTIERRLAEGDLSARQRRSLRGRAAFIRAEAAGLESVVALRVAGEASSSSLGLADRVIDALRPGGAPRPQPIWAGIAGLITGLALCALWLVVRPPR
jgi:hypothetical protein